ncbi:heavy metal-binding domain-containing protein [Shewanella sp. CG12_big_fil_rev_8_21_14_0_65_47_15]|uniref:heavy metal-binding domain-containing protein n=1 Tax=Shewanella sp. CG12_big_fil_rev_8_21_14_0_65_47_15 TaxID=1975537 RepID=UPI000CB28776|nr:heavy metal-binding domain-containing protein [Shewanella sp. CG12_big_fil_rev_8_21_14_0_65_47_15]PIW62982.1 MAG: hypothetical protein COW15_00330 [Shewanella sp. CG12_big_fil_rev_8_21_14_0_65_47_15]
MKTLTNLVLVVFLMTSTSVFATATPHEHQHDNASTQQQAQTYACPMHPEVTGAKGDTCPKCGMDLEPKAAEAKTAEGTVHKAHEHH